jgi:plastocyanin
VQSAAASLVIEVHDNTFAPEVVSAPPGTSVEWHWNGGNLHNVTGDGFATDALSSGVFRHTFSHTGRYPYRCTLHAHMLGEVDVG